MTKETTNVEKVFFNTHPTYTGDFTSASETEGVFDSGCNTKTYVEIHGDVMRETVIHTDNLYYASFLTRKLQQCQ